jgi:hypothetical protein
VSEGWKAARRVGPTHFGAGIADPKLLIRSKGPCRHVPGLHDEFMQSAQAFSAFTRERLKALFQPLTDEANFFYPRSR